MKKLSFDSIDITSKSDVEKLQKFYGIEDEQDAIQKHYEDNGWVVTDIDNGQAYKEIEEDQVYLFREIREVEPGTLTVYESEMRMDEYDWYDVMATCEHFGYPSTQIDDWWNRGEEVPLILECFFELES